MVEIGSKVYAYKDGKVHVGGSGEEVIGTIVEITESGWYIIHSILDDQMYMHPEEDIFEVGAGPVMTDNPNTVYEDYYV